MRDKAKDKKLLLVINHIDWFWSHRLPLAQGAQQAGFSVSVAVNDAHKNGRLHDEGFTGHELPDAQKGFTPLTSMKILINIHRIIKAERPTHVHAITLKYAFLTGIAARFHKDICIIHTLAGLGYLFSGDGLKPKMLRFILSPFLKFALKAPHIKLIFQNPDDMALMMRRGFADQKQCTLIRGSGVDLNAFKFTPLPQDECPIILMPTRLVHDKGVAVFIEATKICAQRGVKARFQIAGGISQSNPRAISKVQMDNMLANSDVEWLGKIDDMATLYQAATIICYPSYYGEGVPKVLLEAAATGRPIITTNHAGCREAVEDGVNGMLVPSKDATATANAIQILIQDPQKCETMGKASRALAEREYDVTNVVKRTLAVYC